MRGRGGDWECEGEGRGGEGIGNVRGRGDLVISCCLLYIRVPFILFR